MMNQEWDQLQTYLERATAFETALILLEWDQETLAPPQASAYTSKIQGNLSAAYQEWMTADLLPLLLDRCEKEGNLTKFQMAILREAREVYEKLSVIPPSEYRSFKELIAHSGKVWAKAKENSDFDTFRPVLAQIIDYKKKIATYQAKNGKGIYDVMLGDYEKDFGVVQLDLFFQKIKQELVPFLQQIQNSKVVIQDDFLTGNYPVHKQMELAHYLAEYVGFDFERGVLAVSAHPFTTNLHNHDVRITTHYTDHLDSSLFSVIHEAGHGIYELGVSDEWTQTLVGQGASMGMHESQSRFFENMIGRREAFWEPIYAKVQELFPEQLKQICVEDFVKAINKVEPGLIRTEADELTYSLHVLIRYELERELMEGDLQVEQLPHVWAEKYEKYLGIKPECAACGVLQDIHWAQGSFGYFPSYALGSAFAAQFYHGMERELPVEEFLRQGNLKPIVKYLNQKIHQYGKIKLSSSLLKEVTGEDFNPDYYLNYLKEKYSRIYGLSI